MSREATQLALELIEPIAHNSTDDPRGKAYEAITALRQALVDADDTSQERVDEIVKDEHEPVAWRFRTGTFWNREMRWRYLDSLEGTKGLLGLQPLYTAPPKREWVGLHGSEVPDPYKYDVMFNEGWWWAEEKLKEKNA